MRRVHTSALVGHRLRGIGRLPFRHDEWWRSREWECEAQGRTTTGPIFGPDMPTVGCHDTTANRQAQSCTDGLSRSLDAIEFLKNMLRISRGQAWPLVSDLDHHGAVRGPGREENRTPRRRVFDRIVEQIDQYLLDQHTIEGHKREVRGQVGRQWMVADRSEEHTSELQSRLHL